MRIYHPDYRISVWDRLLDPAGTARRAARPAGVDYTLLNRAAIRAARAFLDEKLTVGFPGDEMVCIDSGWRLPTAQEARRELCEALALRIRFWQLQPGGVKVPVAIRWMDFQDMPHGTRLLLRLLDRPNPGLQSFVAGNLSEEGTGEEEYAIAAD